MSGPTTPRGRGSRAEPGRSWETWLLGLRNPSGAIYGTLVAAAVLATEGSSRTGVVEIALVVLATLMTYWFAHGYAEMLPERAREQSAGVRVHPARDLGRALRNESSIVGGCCSLLAVLLASAALGASTETAVDLALGFAVFELLLWGLLAAHGAGLRGWSVAAYGVGTAALGLAIATLKVLLQH